MTYLLRICGLSLGLAGTLFAQTNAPAPAGTPPAIPPNIPDNITFEPDVVFGKGGTQDLHADIAYPKNATKPIPAVIYIHGGGWSGGTHKNGPILVLAKGGIFGASIEYRLTKTAKWPAQIQDCKLAVRWLRANAAKYNIDPNHIGAWGGSAGGQLVVCLGTTAGNKELEGDGGYPGVSSAVQAVVDLFGPVDFVRTDISTPSATKAFQGLLGVPYAENPVLWKSASPLYSVTASSPPMLIVHGDADTMIPMAQSYALADALQQAGVLHEIVVVKGGTHGFHLNPGQTMSPNWGQLNKKIIDFLKQYLAAPPTQ